MKVVHYVNQFFGGLGGEEHAGAAPRVQDGAVGPGRLLEQVLPGAQVVRTIIAGDNYAAENLTEFQQLVVQTVREAGAELFVAGPCFEAGRYGVAAGAACAAVQAELGIPVITGMAVENPGVDVYRRDLYIVDSGTRAAAMRDVLTKMARLVQKLAANEPIGLPAEEGYIAKGLMRGALVEKTAAQRLVDMMLAKVGGQPYTSEIMATSFPPIPAPPPVANIGRARIAIVTDGGIVPKGNPDKIAPNASTNWGAYDISALDDLKGEDWEVSHNGFDTRFAEEDPDRYVPVDVLRVLERNGEIGKVHEKFYSWSGLANPMANSRRLGREIAEQLKAEEVDAVILVSA